MNNCGGLGGTNGATVVGGGIVGNTNGAGVGWVGKTIGGWVGRVNGAWVGNVKGAWVGRVGRVGSGAGVAACSFFTGFKGSSLTTVGAAKAAGCSGNRLVGRSKTVLAKLGNGCADAKTGSRIRNNDVMVADGRLEDGEEDCRLIAPGLCLSSRPPIP